MFSFVGNPVLSGDIFWQNLRSMYHRWEGEGITIRINFHGRVTRREVRAQILGFIEQGRLPFLSYEGGYNWTLDLDAAKDFFADEEFAKADWANGKIPFEQETEFFESEFVIKTSTTSFAIHFMKEQIEELKSQRIFLSHKSANKPLVRDVAKVLRTLGYQPWLDEDEMHAGTNLERGLLQGMKDSCAAVFFITPEYEDKKYLAAEIEYAVAEKRVRDARFALMVFVFSDSEGKAGTVPDLLRPYVWKEPSTPLDLLNEIVKALPIRPSGIVWR